MCNKINKELYPRGEEGVIKKVYSWGLPQYSHTYSRKTASLLGCSVKDILKGHFKILPICQLTLFFIPALPNPYPYLQPKRYPFRTGPPRLVHYREYPPPPPGFTLISFRGMFGFQFVAAGDHLVHHCPTWKWFVFILIVIS